MTNEFDLEEERVECGGENAALVQPDSNEDEGSPLCLLPRFLAFSAAAFVIGSLLGASARVYLRGGAVNKSIPPFQEDGDLLTYDSPKTTIDGISDTSEEKLEAANFSIQLEESEHPPLSDLVQGDEIIGDVSWELNFAVVGFPKCGTSFIMRYLNHSNETYLHNHELCALTFNTPARLANMYHNVSRINKDGRQVKVGLKCPKDTETDWGLRHYSSYFPKTDFIVTTRHPVTWFQSFYNYRSYQHYPNRLPDPLDLIGPCREDSAYVCAHNVTPIEECRKQNVCTERSKFHYPLSRLGKTPLTSEREKELLRGNRMAPAEGLTGRVFIMEVSQLALKGEAANQFVSDISEFLGLEEKLPDLYSHYRPNRYNDEKRTQDFINICDEKYRGLREVLISGGRDASEWIRDFFLESPDVVVSSKDHFLELTEKWQYDPCN